MTFKIEFGLVKQKFFVLVVSVSLLMDSIEPVVLENNSALTADRAFGIVIVRTVVRSIDSIEAVADSFIEGVDFHPFDGFVEGFSNESGYFFDYSIFVFDIKVNPK